MLECLFSMSERIIIVLTSIMKPSTITVKFMGPRSGVRTFAVANMVIQCIVKMYMYIVLETV